MAAQTDLSCSVMILARVLLPLPRRDRRRAPGLASSMLPSPRNDRLGSRIVSLSRLQASRNVAARVLAPCCAAHAASHAFETRLRPSGSLPLPRACYSALRRFPRRDLHPLDHHSMTAGSRRDPRRGFCRRHDAPPPKFTPEEITGIIALACESPADSGLPVSHWTPPELAREAVRRGIVESISPRQVDRFLAKRTCDRTRASIG